MAAYAIGSTMVNGRPAYKMSDGSIQYQQISTPANANRSTNVGTQSNTTIPVTPSKPTENGQFLGASTQNKPNPYTTYMNVDGRGSVKLADLIGEGKADEYGNFIGSQRQGAEDQSKRALEAAIGVFNAKKQSILDRIPGVEESARLRMEGLDQGLNEFNTAATREEGNRITGLQDEQNNINEAYTRVDRGTRQSAKSVARQLRNMYAGLGTLDSTAYRDENIETSKEFLQTLGDTRREKSGKITANIREQEDIKKYFGEQKLSEQKRVQIEKEKVKSEKDDIVRGIINDANLTDAQKVEAVVNAQERLDARMAQLDQMEAEYKMRKGDSDREFALKVAELQNKGTSQQYKDTVANQKAIQQANAVIQSIMKDYGNVSPQQAAQIFTQFGVDPEDAMFFGQLYSKDDSDAELDF